MKNFVSVLFLLLTGVINLLAEDVSVTVNGYNLKGTLEIPNTNTPVEVVLIIAGSGPTNRDGNNPYSGNCNSYKMLADLFLKEGIASLRYDKRGIGANQPVNENDLLFETYITDAVEWIKFLQNDKRFSKVTVLGHSEGSLIGMVAAQKAGAQKYISLCGAGKPIYKVLDEQIAQQRMPEYLVKQYHGIVDSLKNGYEAKNVDPSLYSVFRPEVQKYMISWFKYDPTKEIAKLQIPILVVGGTTDIQVKAEDAQLLSKANPKAKLAIVQNMNHVLKTVTTTEPMENFKSYSNEMLPLSEELCGHLKSFFK